jgi:hypothetical protein
MLQDMRDNVQDAALQSSACKCAQLRMTAPASSACRRLCQRQNPTDVNILLPLQRVLRLELLHQTLLQMWDAAVNIAWKLPFRYLSRCCPLAPPLRHGMQP